LSPGKALEKMRAEQLREQDRAKLVALRQALSAARRRRRKALSETVKTCKRARVTTAERVKVFRAEELQRIRAMVAQMKQQARNRCQARKHRIRQAGGGVVARERAQLREERRLQEQLRRLAAAAKRKKLRVAASAKERRAESDDYVRGNLPAELVPVFNRVRAQIKGGARTTRTEAFLQWAEENPGDVLEYQSHDTDREVARLVAEHEQVTRKLRKGKAHYRKLAASDVPF
jgi:hypothetical protein